jgi:hypothetical protein
MRLVTVWPVSRSFLTEHSRSLPTMLTSVELFGIGASLSSESVFNHRPARATESCLRAYAPLLPSVAQEGRDRAVIGERIRLMARDEDLS